MPPRPSRPRLAAAAALLAASLSATAALAASAHQGAPIATAAATGKVAAGPTGVSGVAGVDSASISFTAPPPATPPVVSYTVTAYPGREQGFGATSPVTVTGLQPNVAYTSQVSAANAAGRGPGSAPSPAITALAPPAGVTPPTLSAFTISRLSFFVASGGGSSGTTFSYSDSAAATTTLSVLRVRDGAKRAGACVVEPAGGRGCESLLLVGTLTRTDVAGQNTIRFAGRIGGHRLTAGLYEVRLTPTLNGVPGNTLKGEIDVF